MATRSMLVLTLGLVVLLGVAPHGAGAAQPFVDPIQPAFQNPSAAHAGGSPIGSNFFISNQSVDAVVPAVAYNSNNEQYLVVWYNDRPGNDDIEAQRVSKRGALLGGSFFIAGGAGAERRYPDVAYNSQRNEYMVVWVEEDTAGLSYTSIQAQRVPAGGGTQGGPITVLSGSNLWTPGKPAVAYASTSDRYLVVWHEANHPSITTDTGARALPVQAPWMGSRRAFLKTPVDSAGLNRTWHTTAAATNSWSSGNRRTPIVRSMLVA